jgi:hypothetical protein
MTIDIFEQWYEPTKWPKWSQWESVFDIYLSERGVERQYASRHVPNHPTFNLAHFNNWLRILPDDTVPRLCTTEDLLQEFSEIITEVYSSLEQDIQGDLKSSEVARQDTETHVGHQSGIEAYLCTQIGGRLRGQVNFDKLQAGEFEVQENHKMEPPDGPITVEVRSRNRLNLEDSAIFSVEKGFFEGNFGDDTLMYHTLSQSGLEPDRVINNLAFDWEGNSWIRSSPPTTAIAATSTDHKNRVDYYKIESPANIYGDAWGDLSEMHNEETEFKESHPESDEITHIYSGRPDWILSTGVRY